MTLPAFASLSEFAARIAGGIATADETRAQAALDDASSLIRDEGTTYVDDNGDLDLPDGDDAWKADSLKRICISAARRTFDNPDGVTQETIGGYSVAQSNSSPDVYLTAAERRAVRKINGNAVGLGTVYTTRGPLEPGCSADYTYLDVEPAGEQIPAGPWPLP